MAQLILHWMRGICVAYDGRDVDIAVGWTCISSGVRSMSTCEGCAYVYGM